MVQTDVWFASAIENRSTSKAVLNVLFGGMFLILCGISISPFNLQLYHLSCSYIHNLHVRRSPSVLTQSPEDIPPIDPRAILELETQAHRVAVSVDHMLAALKVNLHKVNISSTFPVQCDTISRVLLYMPYFAE